MSTKSSSRSKAEASGGAGGPLLRGPRDGLFALAENVKSRRLLENVVDRADGSEPLSKIGEKIAEVTGKVVKPGKFKGLLSGTWLGHPAHPMLTDLPIGFWTSSFVLDVVGGKKCHAASDSLVAMGVAAAMPTAMTGLSDLADVSEDEGLRIGTVHAIANTAALLCYALSLSARKKGHRQAGVVWSTAGATLATAGGYFGGHMAYRRGIGVNQTAFEKFPGEWTKVLPEGELKEGEPRRVVVEGGDVLLYRNGENVWAIANRCSHRGGPLDEGRVGDGAVTCPLHASTFSLEDGSVLAGPATAPQPPFEARINRGQVEVRSRR